jgi:hypothetical protein
MYQVVVSGPWIAAQVVRVRTLEKEVAHLLSNGTSQAFVRTRVAELNSQLALLDLALD